jgi:hypothetical protein
MSVNRAGTIRSAVNDEHYVSWLMSWAVIPDREPMPGARQDAICGRSSIVYRPPAQKPVSPPAQINVSRPLRNAMLSSAADCTAWDSVQRSAANG